MLEPVYNSGYRGVISTLCNPNLTEFTRMTDIILSKQIPLTQGKFATVDAEDYDFLMQWKWCTDARNAQIFYAKTNLSHAGGVKRATDYMHRIVMNASRGLHVDHINHNTLDNRKCNLRICSAGQNRCNEIKREGFTSKYKGVFWAKHAGKWAVHIKISGKGYNLGYYNSETEAALTYNEAAKKYHGEFARLNEI